MCITPRGRREEYFVPERGRNPIDMLITIAEVGALYCKELEKVFYTRIKYVLLTKIVRYCGYNVLVRPNVYLFSLHNSSIRSNVSIYPMWHIDATSDIKIGNNVAIVHGTTITSSTYRYNNANLLIKDQSSLLL